jgi:hypothetical protein
MSIGFPTFHPGFPRELLCIELPDVSSCAKLCDDIDRLSVLEIFEELRLGFFSTKQLG